MPDDVRDEQEAEAESEWLTLGEAADEYVLTRNQLTRMVKAGELIAYYSARDRREKLIRRGDLEAALDPRPITLASPRAS